jgi:hypothetical protein
MSEVWENDDDVPYQELGRRLFAPTGRQEMIPFLGAGASVSARVPEPAPNPPGFPDEAKMQSIFSILGMDGSSKMARANLEYAIRAVLWMQTLEASAPERSLIDSLAANTYPPFAYELSLLFSELASYTQFQDRPLSTLRKRRLLPDEAGAPAQPSLVRMFRLLAEVTGVGQSSDPLASIAEYHQYKTDRQSVRDELRRVFSNKVTPTPTHELVARAAKHHLLQDYAEDYLIITTNYDVLMEKALEAQGVPYAVITVDRSERRAHAHFVGMNDKEAAVLKTRNPPLPARQFSLNKGGRALVVLFKMHGCLNPTLDVPDGIVITEADYVDFISHLDDVLPAAVGTLLPAKRLLFLGYSFSDWNVRSIYESIARRADEQVKDYAVTLSLSRFEKMYFQQRNIGLILKDLGSFTARLSELAPSDTPAAAPLGGN